MGEHPEQAGERAPLDMATHVDQVKAEFHALWYTLGPFGRQDIHLHPRIDREARTHVLVGFGRTCDPKGLHAQMVQAERSSWWNAGHEGEPLAGVSGKSPRRPKVVHIGGQGRNQ